MKVRKHREVGIQQVPLAVIVEQLIAHLTHERWIAITEPIIHDQLLSIGQVTYLTPSSTEFHAHEFSGQRRGHGRHTTCIQQLYTMFTTSIAMRKDDGFSQS